MLKTVKSNKQEHGQLTNYMEELADTVLESLLVADKGHRFSDDNITDIKALALNRLWPMYTTSEAGRDFIRRIVQEDKVEKDVIRELRAAMDKVRLHPSA